MINKYLVENKNKQERLTSSSGGIFSALSNYFIENNGVVCGVSFDNDFNSVFHRCVYTKSDLEKLKGSKYIDTNKISKELLDEIDNNLNAGKKVLFIGRPCQIFYLKNKISHDNLYCVEISCFGVPKDFLWSDYKKNIENEHNSKIVNVSFRDKSTGWSNYSIKISFENGDVLLEDHMKNDYMKKYLSRKYMKESCKTCKLDRDLYVNADIQIGDAWGVSKIKNNDNLGTSVCISYSKKGDELIDILKSTCNMLQISDNEIDVLSKNNYGLRIRKRKIVITCTTFKGRIKTIHLVLSDLLNNTKKVDALYLNLSTEEFPNKENDLPKELIDLTKKYNNLIINWVDGPNTKCMKKLFPILDYLNDDDIILSVDDDFRFPKDYIESRLNEFYKNNEQPISGAKTKRAIITLYSSKKCIVSSAACSVFTKKMFNHYKEVLTHDVITSYHDDGVYTTLLYLNGYEMKMCERYASWTDTQNKSYQLHNLGYARSNKIIKQSSNMILMNLEKIYCERPDWFNFFNNDEQTAQSSIEYVKNINPTVKPKSKYVMVGNRLIRKK